jgi:TonB family protein
MQASWIAVGLWCWAAVASAQTAAEAGEPLPLSEVTTKPRLLRKVQPSFPDEAKRWRVQATVGLQVVIDEQGNLTEITVVSPAGYGLDDEALKAVRQWKFAPATKNGVAVCALAQIDVGFRLDGLRFDGKMEERRTKFNRAAEVLNRRDAKPAELDRAVEAILALCREEFPSALKLAGEWKIKGEHVPQNEAEGLAWMQKAAAARYGPALYEVGKRHMEGRDLPMDFAKGLEEVRAAASLGSIGASYYLAARYEKGDGLARDVGQARTYYRLCAARSVPSCQYRLGRLLLDEAGRKERDYVQAVALLQLASEGGLTEAKEPAAAESARLTPAQRKAVASMKVQIVQK